MPYYQKHWFICINERSNGKASCGNAGNKSLCGVLKQKVKQMGLAGPKKWRISSSGCLDRCAEGPLLVVYPEGHWYRCPDEAALDAILVYERDGGPKPEYLCLPDEPPRG